MGRPYESCHLFSLLINPWSPEEIRILVESYLANNVLNIMPWLHLLPSHKWWKEKSAFSWAQKEINDRKRATKALCTTGHKNVAVLLLWVEKCNKLFVCLFVCCFKYWSWVYSCLFVCLFVLWAGFRSLTDSPRMLIHLWLGCQWIVVRTCPMIMNCPL